MSRNYVWAVAALLAIQWPAPAQFDEDEEDRPKQTRAEQSRDTDADAWQAHLQKLGAGPIYRIEVLYFEETTNRFFLHQTLLSANVPRANSMFGMGLGDFNQPIPSPDPSHVRPRDAMEIIKAAGGGDPPAPLAWRTHYFRASLERPDAKPGEVIVAHSDLATAVKLPTRPGEISRNYFGAIWRIEYHDAVSAAKLRPLRQDVKYFRERVKLIRAELKGRAFPELVNEHLEEHFRHYLPRDTR